MFGELERKLLCIVLMMDNENSWTAVKVIGAAEPRSPFYLKYTKHMAGLENDKKPTCTCHGTCPLSHGTDLFPLIVLW